MEPKTRDFALALRSRLLSDDYGGWKKLDRKLLDALCERVAIEAEEFIFENIDEYKHANRELVESMDKLRKTFNESAIIPIRPLI